MSLLDYQMMAIEQALRNGAGLVAIAGFFLMGAFALVVRAMRWGMIILLMYVSTLGLSEWTGAHFAFPLQQMRAYGRGICGILLLLLLIPTIRSARGWRRKLVMGGLIAFFLFQMVAVIRILFGGDFGKGFLGIISYALTFLTLGWGMARWMQTPKNAISAVRCLVAAGALFVIGSLYQYVINPSQCVWAGRFLGTTGNANHAGVLLGVALLPTVYLFLKSRKPVMRIATAALAGSIVVLLLWSASRTGAVVAVCGIVLLFRLRLGKFVVAAVFCGIFVYILLYALQQAGIGTVATRLLSTDNTRTQAWASMFHQFKESPLWGVTGEEAQWSENSYLLVLSRTGLVGAIPFVFAMVLVFFSLLRLQKLRPFLGEHVLLADLAISGIGSLAVGAVFEGYLYAIYSYPLYAIFVYANLVAFLTDYGQAVARCPSPPQPKLVGSEMEQDQNEAASFPDLAPSGW